MKRLFFRLSVSLLAALLMLSLFRVSDRALVPVLPPEEQSGYIADDEIIASIGGLGLSYAEYRYQVFRALSSDLGLTASEADLTYDEELIALLPKLALHRAALWRAVTRMAMEANLTVPDPPTSVVEALCSEPYMTENVAFGEYHDNALRSLLYLNRYGADASLFPEERAIAWGNEAAVVRLRVLWLSADREQYHADEIADRLSQLKIFLAQLRQGDADFDTLCRVYSEKQSDAEGMQLLPSCAEQELYRAALSVSENDYAVCQTERFVCLVMRLPLSAEAETGGSTLRVLAAQADFAAALSEAADSLSVSYRKIWKKIQLNKLF